MIIFITGGVKSGKSWYALQTAVKRLNVSHFIATGVAFDEEMRLRIEKHRQERDGRLVTVEEPVDIDRCNCDSFLLDDLTVWMNNLFYEKREEEWEEILERFMVKLQRSKDALVVSNETGWGNIPMDAVTRKYNRYLGEANRRVAKAADEVYLMVSGIPVQIRGNREELR